LHHLGHEIGRNTIKRLLNDYGIEPAPERGRKTPWKTFLAAHWDAIAAADFFAVEVLTACGLVRYFVFFVVRLETRRVEIAGITCSPCGEWTCRSGRDTCGWLSRSTLSTTTSSDLIRNKGASGPDHRLAPLPPSASTAYGVRLARRLASRLQLLPLGPKNVVFGPHPIASPPLAAGS